MKRGDIVLTAIPGDYGKSRPVVIVQNDIVNDTHASFVVCPITSHLVDSPIFRLTIEPNAKNGLEISSQIMVDKISVLKRERIKKRIGRVSDEMLVQINRAMAFWLGL